MEEKEVRRFDIPFKFDWLFGVEIKEIRKNLDELEKLGANEIYVAAESSYNDPYLVIKAYANRMETDDEFKSRIDRKKSDERANENYERNLMQKLKEKYEQRG